MDRDVLDVIEREFDDEAKIRFPGGAVRRVMLLQYGEDPEIEPGDLWVGEDSFEVTRLGPGNSWRRSTYGDAAGRAATPGSCLPALTKISCLLE